MTCENLLQPGILFGFQDFCGRSPVTTHSQQPATWEDLTELDIRYEIMEHSKISRIVSDQHQHKQHRQQAHHHHHHRRRRRRRRPHHHHHHHHKSTVWTKLCPTATSDHHPWRTPRRWKITNALPTADSIASPCNLKKYMTFGRSWWGWRWGVFFFEKNKCQTQETTCILQIYVTMMSCFGHDKCFPRHSVPPRICV